MKSRRSFVFFIFITLSLLINGYVSAQTAKEWCQDIDILAKIIETYHPVPWAKISRIDFMERAETIKTKLKAWNKEKIILEVMKLVASLRDGHTNVLLSNRDDFNNWFPLRFEKFHDGIFITATDITNSVLLGANVLNIGKIDAASVKTGQSKILII